MDSGDEDGDRLIPGEVDEDRVERGDDVLRTEDVSPGVYDPEVHEV